MRPASKASQPPPNHCAPSDVERSHPLTFEVCARDTGRIHRPSIPMPRPLDLLQGTLDLLILKTLSWGPAHGYAIARWIEQLTGEVLTVGEGSLYPALHR